MVLFFFHLFIWNLLKPNNTKMEHKMLVVIWTIDDYDDRRTPMIRNDDKDERSIATRGDDYQLLLGVNRQSVSPVMQGPSSAPIQELVIGSHTTDGIMDWFHRMVINMKLLTRHRQEITERTGSIIWYECVILWWHNFKIDELSQQGEFISFLLWHSLLFLFLYIKNTHNWLLWNIDYVY